MAIIFYFWDMSTETGEIRITNVPSRLFKEINAIASNLGVDRGQFLKIKLKEIADSYPKEMKEVKKD